MIQEQVKGYVGFFFLLHLNVIFLARRKVLVFFSRLPLGLFLSSAWVKTFSFPLLKTWVKTIFNNHSTNRRTRYKGRFPKLRVRVRYALSLAARRRALARGKKDSLRVLQGEWQCYQQNLSFVFFFNSLLVTWWGGLYNLLLSLLKRRLAGLSSKGKVSHSRVT